jgi:HEPN domain-containing protein
MNELPDNNYEEARRWLRNVEDDLRALRHTVDGEETPGRIGCFLAHLTVEKALKAVLIDAEVPFKKTHDLEALYALCTEAGRLPGVDVAELAALNPWAIDGRYTDDLREATRREATRFAVFAEAVVAAVRAELGGS